MSCEINSDSKKPFRHWWENCGSDLHNDAMVPSLLSPCQNAADGFKGAICEYSTVQKQGMVNCLNARASWACDAMANTFTYVPVRMPTNFVASDLHKQQLHTYPDLRRSDMWKENPAMSVGYGLSGCHDTCHPVT
jgi:hypothetical protein